MPAASWTIGPFREGDLPEILILEREAFCTPWSEAQFRQELSLSLSTILVARSGEGKGFSLLGYLVYWLVCDEMHLQDIAVRSEQRRQGIASGLLAAALRQARIKGARQATLEVRQTNQAAQGLYEAFGFTLSGRRKGYYSDRNEDALIYWANLDITGDSGRSPERVRRKHD
ncbi:MAG: ribosomal protein S18-alanine N-acetyltransferase [Syntrophaceae bacterium]|nr:ribosomal protein S18-alanine N-acetyltransferase [Syntrophaceae bacterium]